MKVTRPKKIKNVFTTMCMNAFWNSSNNSTDKDFTSAGPCCKRKLKISQNNLIIRIFKASNGYIESFQDKQNIVFWNICGECSSNFRAFVNNGLKKLPSLLERDNPAGFFNADDTSLVFQSLWSKTRVFLKVTNADVENNAKCVSLYSWSLIKMEVKTSTIDNNSSFSHTHMFPTTLKSAIIYPIN